MKLIKKIREYINNTYDILWWKWHAPKIWEAERLEHKRELEEDQRNLEAYYQMLEEEENEWREAEVEKYYRDIEWLEEDRCLYCGGLYCSCDEDPQDYRQ